MFVFNVNKLVNSSNMVTDKIDLNLTSHLSINVNNWLQQMIFKHAVKQPKRLCKPCTVKLLTKLKSSP
jgi:hypothetical protein